MSSDVEHGVRGVLALGDAAERARLWELPDRRVVMAMSTIAGIVFVALLTMIFAAMGVSSEHESPAPPAPGATAGTSPGQSGSAPNASGAQDNAAAAAAAAASASRRRAGANAGANPAAPAAANAHAASGATFSAARVSVLVLDYPSKHFPYPFTIQNFMHVLFFIGLGELFVRWRVAKREMRFMKRRYLPEDEETVLQFPDLGPIRRKVAKAFDGEHGFLPSLIDLSVLQFQASRSVDQTVAVMNNALELIAHRVELRYGLIRFIAWMVPTVGFIGTVYGLGASLYEAGAAAEVNFQETARTLGVGFDCTMVALIQSAILVFLMHLAEEEEELSVNLAGGYCLRNLINRLYTGRAS